MELTEAIDGYLRKKLKTLEKFVSEDGKAEIIVGKTSQHHKSGDVFQAEIRIRQKGELTRVVTEAEDLYAAIDVARDEMADSLSSKKDKKKTLALKGAQTLKKMVHGERLDKPMKKLKKKAKPASKASKPAAKSKQTTKPSAKKGKK